MERRVGLFVWRAGAAPVAVDLSPSMRGRVASEGGDLVELSRAEPLIPALLRAMRPHQWLKNLLIFVPLALIAPRATFADVVTFGWGFVAFSLLTSGTYLVNDIMDVEVDRHHPSKSRRPIANGALSLPAAAAASMMLVGLGLLGAALLSGPFLLVALAYLLLTLSYSFWLKSIPIIDVLVIASLFALRVLAGMVLIEQPLSEWLLAFSTFFFLSLALIKRYVELSALLPNDPSALRGRGYTRADQTFVLTFGVGAGMASLVIFALFISSVARDPDSHYVGPQLLWVAMALVSYWLMRMWLLTTRGLMTDDPILYAARERATLIIAITLMAVVIAAQVLPL